MTPPPSAPPAGSTCSPPIPTRAGRSTASCSAGRPRSRTPSSAATSTSQGRRPGRGRHAQRRVVGHARRVVGVPRDATTRRRRSTPRPRTAAQVIVPAMAVDGSRHDGRRDRPRRRARSACGSPALHKGFGIFGEPGTPAWFELHTRDYDASVAFYRDVFKWDTHTMSDTPEFRYTTLGEGDGQLAGIMDASAFLPEGVPRAWSIYFARRRHRQGARADRRARRHGRRARARTRRTDAWPRRPTPPARASSSWPAD